MTQPCIFQCHLSYDALSRNDSRIDSIQRLASDFYIISEWDKENLVISIVSKVISFIYQLNMTFQATIPSSLINNIKLTLSFTRNSLWLSFTKNLN